MAVTISRDDQPSPGDVRVLSAGLASHGEEHTGPTWIKNIAFYLRDDAGEAVGGVFGNFGSFGWLYVDTLWIAPEVRGKGHGRDLMEQIESAAVHHKCHSSYLSTFSFQAPQFYKKLGYVVFGELGNFPEGQSRIFLRKKLS